MHRLHEPEQDRGARKYTRNLWKLIEFTPWIRRSISTAVQHELKDGKEITLTLATQQFSPTHTPAQGEGVLHIRRVGAHHLEHLGEARRAQPHVLGELHQQQHGVPAVGAQLRREGLPVNRGGGV